MTSPLVSIIVCTRDRPEDIARCLPTLLANDYEPFEVVIIDQSADDRSERLVRELADPRIRYQHQQVRGKSRALNAAISLATGSVLAHTDDDCAVPVTWLEQAVKALGEAPDVDIIFGAVTTAAHDGDTFLPGFKVQNTRLLTGWRGRLAAQALAGANMIVRRSVYDKLGGFDECLGPGSRFRSGDDDDLAYRALRNGFTVMVDPRNSVVHWGKRSYRDGTARQLLRNYRYGDGASFIKHLRCGDPVAALGLLREAWIEVRYLAGNLMRERRLSGAGRLWYLARGAAEGFVHPLDRKRGVYVLEQPSGTASPRG